MPMVSRRALLGAAGLATASAGGLSLLTAAPAAAKQPAFKTIRTERLTSMADPGTPCGPSYLGGLRLDTDGTPLAILNEKWVSHATYQGNWLNRHLQSYELDKQRGHLTITAKALDGIIGRAKKFKGTVMPTYNFPWDGNGGMKANWVSSFGQSKFPAAAHRLYVYTGERKWLELRDQLMAAFELPVSTTDPYVAGVDASSYLWLDEYPNESGLSRVFNGHMYALSELLFYAELSNDPRAWQLVKGAVATAYAYRDFCRVKNKVSRYYVGRTTALSSYQPIHYSCYNQMYRYTGLSGFATTSDQLRRDWTADFRAGVVRVLPGVTHVIRTGGTVGRWTPTKEYRIASKGRGSVSDSSAWSRMNEGPHAGWFIQESTAAFRMGFDTDSLTYAPRPLWFNPGTHNAFAFSDNGIRHIRKTITLDRKSMAHAIKVAKIGGRWYWLMKDGALAGLWVAEGANNYFDA